MATGQYPRRTSGVLSVNHQPLQVTMVRPCLPKPILQGTAEEVAASKEDQGYLGWTSGNGQPVTAAHQDKCINWTTSERNVSVYEG